MASIQLTKPLWGKDKSTHMVCKGRLCGQQQLHLEKQLLSAVQAVLWKAWHEGPLFTGLTPSFTEAGGLTRVPAQAPCSWAMCPFPPTGDAAASSGQVLYKPWQGLGPDLPLYYRAKIFQLRVLQSESHFQ